MKNINWTIAILLILSNIYFLPLTFVTLKEMGGAMGYGLLILPFSLSINLLLITAGLTFKNKFNDSVGLLIINSIGFAWTLFWLYLLISNPKMD